MLPMQSIRNWQLLNMKNAQATVRYILEKTDVESLTSYRDGGEGWTALEVLGHLRDYEVVFYERVNLTKTQEMPDLPFPEPNQLAATNNYNGLDIWEVYEAWVANRQRLLMYMETLTEDDWERPAKHPTRGILTIHDQLFLMAWHDINHLEQMTRILLERKL